MPIEMHGETYYKTSEAARLASISRSTLLRWLHRGIIKETSRRDRRGWRLFTKADIKRIADEAQKVKYNDWSRGSRERMAVPFKVGNIVF